MRIETDNLWAYPEAGRGMPLIIKALTYQAKGARYSKAFQNGWWDGNVCLLRGKDDTPKFPVGLVPYITRFLNSHDVQVEITVRENSYKHGTPSNFSANPLVELDANQKAAVETARKAHRGIIKYPTGYGKTWVIGETIRQIRLPTLILSNRIDWAKQLKDDLSPVIGCRVKDFSEGLEGELDCMVAMVPTLSLRIKDPEILSLLSKVGTVIIDEVQYSGGDSYGAVIENCINAEYVLGYSATPFRERGKNDDLKVIGYTGEIIAELGNMDGIEAARIVPADIFIISGLESKETWLNYMQGVDKAIIKNHVRNKAIAKLAVSLAFASGTPTLIIVDREEQGHTLNKLTGCPFLYGKTPAENRTKNLQAFKDGKLPCIIVSKIGDVALNLPNIQALILAAGGRATHRQIQRLGRGMRAVEGKERVMVFDFVDTGKYLSTHYKQRRKLYESDAAYNLVDLTWAELEGWML